MHYHISFQLFDLQEIHKNRVMAINVLEQFNSEVSGKSHHLEDQMCGH
jgi:hypothetical protein